MSLKSLILQTSIDCRTTPVRSLVQLLAEILLENLTVTKTLRSASTLLRKLTKAIERSPGRSSRMP